MSADIVHLVLLIIRDESLWGIQSVCYVRVAPPLTLLWYTLDTITIDILIITYFIIHCFGWKHLILCILTNYMQIRIYINKEKCFVIRKIPGWFLQHVYRFIIVREANWCNTRILSLWNHYLSFVNFTYYILVHHCSIVCKVHFQPSEQVVAVEHLSQCYI